MFIIGREEKREGIYLVRQLRAAARIGSAIAATVVVVGISKAHGGTLLVVV